MKRIFKNNRGIAIFEAACLISMLLTTLMAVFGVIEYLHAVRATQAIVDKYIYDDVVKPFHLAPDGAIVVNTVTLKGFVDLAAKKISDDLSGFLANEMNVKNASFVNEAAYVELNVDPSSGKVSAIKNIPFSHHKIAGDHSLLATLDKGVSLEKEFVSYSKLNGIQDAQNVSGFYAVPQGQFSLQKSSEKFLPSTVLIGVRAGISLQGTFIGDFLSLVGLTPFVTQYKIINLRGELNNES